MSPKFKKIIPLLLILAIFGASALFLVRSAAFISKHINDIFVVDEKKAEAGTIKLNIEGFRPAGERLKMEIRD